jgi:uncharacterized membrane protein
MRFVLSAASLLGFVLALTSPASAEFFNCHQRSGQLLYSYSGSASQYSGRSSNRSYSNDFAASTRHQYQAHATYTGARHYWNDRPRW